MDLRLGFSDYVCAVCEYFSDLGSVNNEPKLEIRSLRVAIFLLRSKIF